MKRVREQRRKVEYWNCLKENKAPTGEQAEFTMGLLERVCFEMGALRPKACRVETLGMGKDLETGSEASSLPQLPYPCPTG